MQAGTTPVAPATACPATFPPERVFTSLGALLPTAKGPLAASDSVLVQLGTYDEAVALAKLSGVAFRGDPAAPRPVITSADPVATFVITDGTQLQHLEILHTGPTGAAVRATAPGIGAVNTITDSLVSSAAGLGLLADTPTTVRRSFLDGAAGGVDQKASALEATNSIVTASGAAAAGVRVGPGASATLRNLTVVTTGAGGEGIVASRGADATTTGATVTVSNSIVRADGIDLRAQAAAPFSCIALSPGPIQIPVPTACAAGSLTVDHTNYEDATGDGVTDGGANQRGNPLFTGSGTSGTNPIHEPNRFTVGAGSPTIDAGAAVAAGDLDFAGTARPSGASAPDLGAFETVHLPAQSVAAPFVPGGSVISAAVSSVGFGPTPTPTPSPTTGAFKLDKKVKVGKDGTITFLVTAPGAGSFAAVATTPGQARAKGGRPGASHWGNITLKTTSAGPLTLAVKPGRAARKAAKAAHRAAKKKARAAKQTVTVAITFTPDGGGAPTTVTVTVSVPLRYTAKQGKSGSAINKK